MQKEHSAAIWAEARKHLEAALPEVRALMAQRFAQVGGTPEPGSDLDQCGLKDGAEIVRDYMAHNEWGLALEHLCYMVEETGLPISAKTYASLKAAAQTMLVEASVLRGITPS
ncbi:MAG: MafI family immunity protein [Armatimonadota bacterium]|nr:MafI family immunity protein [Armatimonadota bacterium]